MQRIRAFFVRAGHGGDGTAPLFAAYCSGAGHNRSMNRSRGFRILLKGGPSLLGLVRVQENGCDGRAHQPKHRRAIALPHRDAIHACRVRRSEPGQIQGLPFRPGNGSKRTRGSQSLALGRQRKRSHVGAARQEEPGLPIDHLHRKLLVACKRQPQRHQQRRRILALFCDSRLGFCGDRDVLVGLVENALARGSCPHDQLVGAVRQEAAKTHRRIVVARDRQKRQRAVVVFFIDRVAICARHARPAERDLALSRACDGQLRNLVRHDLVFFCQGPVVFAPALDLCHGNADVVTVDPVQKAVFSVYAAAQAELGAADAHRRRGAHGRALEDIPRRDAADRCLRQIGALLTADGTHVRFVPGMARRIPGGAAIDTAAGGAGGFDVAVFGAGAAVCGLRLVHQAVFPAVQKGVVPQGPAGLQHAADIAARACRAALAHDAGELIERASFRAALTHGKRAGLIQRPIMCVDGLFACALPCLVRHHQKRAGDRALIAV